MLPYCNRSLTVFCLVTAVLLIQQGLFVSGQAGFPSGTEVTCYGKDVTCSAIASVKTLNYAKEGVYERRQESFNPCCNPYDPVWEEYNFAPNNYYKALGSKCQSCEDPNIFHGKEKFIVKCYTDLQCQAGEISDETYQFNSCCGYGHYYGSYKFQSSDECLPCIPMPENLASAGADPHFVCPMSNGQNLCFSVQGIPEFIFNLLSDSNIQLNSKFALPQAEESRLLMNSSTFIQSMGLIVKHPNTDVISKIVVSAIDHSILIAGSSFTVKNYPILITINNGTVTSTVVSINANPDHDETAWVKLITDVGFGINFKFVKKHIDYVITDSSGLTAGAHGIQGQFMGADVSIDQDAGLIKFGDHDVIFSVRKGQIWPYLKMTDTTCWYPSNTDDQGAGVIEGVYTDYIVDDLFSSNFKFNQFN